MNLCGRLQKPTPLGYGCCYMYSYRGVESQGKHELIKEVVERYATRFGAVTFDEAIKLYERLAVKYSSGPGIGVILRALVGRWERRENTGFTEYAHPKEMANNSFNLKIGRDMVKRATDNASAVYGMANDPYGMTRTCRICGSILFYTLVVNSESQHVASRMLRDAYGICRGQRCKAFVSVFPMIKSDRKKLPLAQVLLEITKNGDRSGKIREIEDIAARDVYQTHKRRNRQKTS